MAASEPADKYIQDTQAWQQEQDTKLRSPDSWLSIVGLTWLKPGKNFLYISEAGEIQITQTSSTQPPAGVFELNTGTVYFSPMPAANKSTKSEEFFYKDRPIAASDKLKLSTDLSGQLGDNTIYFRENLSLNIIQRQNLIGIRIKNPNSERRKTFSGRKWYSIDPNLRINADFLPAQSKQTVKMKNVLGQNLEEASAGSLTFKINNKDYKLIVEGALDSGLSLIFRDTTSGHGSYGAARYLSLPNPVNGKIVLDFNRAVNPPCAFTSYATCPLAPPENNLPVEIRAGERYEKSIQSKTG